MKRVISIVLLSSLIVACAPFRPAYVNECESPYVPVAGYVRSFAGLNRLPYAQITQLDGSKKLRANKHGEFGFCALPGEKVTLLAKYAQYKETQSATFIVPEQGLLSKQREVTFQVPSAPVYALLKTIVLKKKNVILLPDRCNVAMTVTAFGKTLDSGVQGEEGAKVIVKQQGHVVNNVDVVYFGVILGKTNPFEIDGDATSHDGGALIYNLPASNIPYLITAEKEGRKFSIVYVTCEKGAFINLSPPHGPMVVS